MLLDQHVKTLVDLALHEDIGSGDITSQAIFPIDHSSCARIIAREDLVVCGVELASYVLERFSLAAAAPFLRPLCTGDVHEDPAHGGSGRSKEVPAITVCRAGLARH